MRRTGLALFIAGLALLALAAGGWAGPVEAQQGGQLALVDAHAHLMGPVGGPHPQEDFAGAAQRAVSLMDRLGLAASVVMPPPFVAGQDHIFDAEELAPQARLHPGRLFFLAGGGSLNPMLHQAAQEGVCSPETEARFLARARQIAELGARGFGEMAALHFSFRPEHPFEEAPADHPLLLKLADLAAQLGLPIDLHLEAVAQPMSLPAGLNSPPNPSRLQATLPGLERLLAHNRGAKIIWAHAGWDNTGQRTLALCRDLLSRHPNLYMSFKLDRRFPMNSAQDAEGRPQAEWVRLVEQFPDRFILGSDHFHLSPRSQQRLPQRAGPAVAFLRALPPELAQKVGWENPRRIFGL